MQLFIRLWKVEALYLQKRCDLATEKYSASDKLDSQVLTNIHSWPDFFLNQN